MQNNSHYADQGQQFWYQSKAHVRLLLVNNTNYYLLFCTVSEIWLIIGKIFASNGSLHFNALSRGDPL